MIKKLMTTRLSGFNILSVKGEEPVRNYKRTFGVIASRMGERYEEFLAEPRFVKDGHVIEWYTTQFESEPRTLSSLEGEEYEQYSRQLSKVMKAYSASLPSPDDDAYPLMTKLVIVPDENCIFCADGKVVVAEWGLKPRSGYASELNLLSYAGKTAFKPEVKPVNVDVVPEEEVDIVTEEAVDNNPQYTPPVNNDSRRQEEERLLRLREEEIKRLAEENERLKNENVKKPKRPWLKWLLIILGILIVAAILFFLFRSCTGAKAETVQQMDKTAPAPEDKDIGLASDSINYVVINRLGILVKEGGDINEFTKAFRQHYPDQEKYKLVSPDTVFNRVTLMCPSDERENLKTEIKEKLSDFKLLITNEGVGVQNSRPNDPAMNNSDESYYFDMVNAIDAWDIEKGKKDVVIAILDGDIDVNHPEIGNKVVKKYDAVTRTGNIPRVPKCDGHGTHTSSIALGNSDNGQGAAGIAPECSLMAINVFGPAGYATVDDQIEGIKYAVENGADIISISIGAMLNPALHDLSAGDQKALAQVTGQDEAELWDYVCKYAEDNGVLIVKSAGNENLYAGLDPHNRSEYELLVSAVDQTGERSIWDPFFMLQGSNFGDDCRISAPGSDIYNSLPDNKYGMKSGTSMSCPMVAGGAALLKSNKPNLTPAQIRDILIATANPQPKDDIGPIMDLVAALNADPNNLPAKPQNPRKFNNPGTPSPGTDPLTWLLRQGPNPNPSNPNPSNPGTQPYRPYNPQPQKPQPSLPFPIPEEDCDQFNRQYQALRQMRDLIDDYMEQLRRECPECL